MPGKRAMLECLGVVVVELDAMSTANVVVQRV